VGGLDDKKVELARLMDRFPLQVHLEPSDISEVTSQARPGQERRARSSNSASSTNSTVASSPANTSCRPTSRCRSSTRAAFIDLYPLLPYQIDLIIQVVSGLRTQGGASKHVGGANRTIIKLAQQLLIHPDVGLAKSRPSASSPGSIRSTTWSRDEHRQRDPRQDPAHPRAGPTRWPSPSPRRSACCSSCRACTAPPRTLLLASTQASAHL
jgi:hypothetical protein